MPDLMAALEQTLADLKGGGGSDGDLSSLSKDELLERAKERGRAGALVDEQEGAHRGAAGVTRRRRAGTETAAPRPRTQTAAG